MDKTIADRLASLRGERQENGAPEVPLTGTERNTGRAKLPGFDGRAARMAPIAKAKGVTSFEASSAPFENLLFNNNLVRTGEAPEVGEARAEAAYAYRDDMQKAQVAALGAQVISDALGGGGLRATLSEHKLFAMQSLGELKHLMGRQEYLLLERVVWNDEWVFLGKEPKQKPKSRAHKQARRRAMEKRRRRAIEEILMVLDLAAAHYGFTTLAEVRARWQRQKSGGRRRDPSSPAAGPGSPGQPPETTARGRP